MNQLIQNPEQIIEFFSTLNNASPMQIKDIEKGLLVNSKTIREFLVSEHQGQVIANGKVYDVQFKNMQGGVWKAFINI